MDMRYAKWGQRLLTVKDYALIGFVLIVFILLNHAGSLVAAAAGAIGGLGGIIGHRITRPRRWPVAIPIGLLFLVWCLLSSLWSPYESPRSTPGVVRYALGLPLYGLLIYIMLSQPNDRKRVWRFILMGLFPLSALIFAIDFMSGYAVFRLGDPDADTGDIIKNLAHGLSVLLLCLPPVMWLLFRHGRGGKMLAAASFIAAAIACANSGNSAAMLAILLIALFMYAAYKFPKTAVRVTLTVPVALVLLAPIISIIASELSEPTKAALPFSWEWRAETWGYLAEKIVQHPFAGHGFDSLRTMKDTFDARGFEGLSYIPLHAHNFGLQLWVEVGLIGALIVSFFFWETGAALSKTSWLTAPRASALCGTIITACVFSALSYSAWQDWWWGAIGFALSFSALIPQDV